MRRHLGPYLAFMASLVLFVYLLRGTGAAVSVALATLALLVWWWVAEVLTARQRRQEQRRRFPTFEE